VGATREAGRRRDGGAVTAIFLLGLALSVLLALRSQVGGDQLNLLARGWLLLARGQWVPYGNPASSGGATPGGVTALLVAGPLLVWRHHRAAVLGIVAAQALGFLLLDRWLRTALSPRGRVLFAALYWLDPWRVLLSGFLWNPGYLPLVGAVHAWTTWRQRRESRWLPSLAHALALGIGFQVHPSVVLLGAASLLLLRSGHLRLRWSAVAVGAVLAAVPLVPWWIAIRARPEMLPVSTGFLGRGLLLVFPLARGVIDWLRHASLSLPGSETRLDFGPLLGEAAAPTVSAAAIAVLQVVGAMSLLLPLLANLWLWRRLRRRDRGAGGAWSAFPARLLLLLRARPSGRAWVAGYVRVCFLAALAVYALAPTTVMWWQGISMLHASVLPLVLSWEALLRLPRRARLRRRVRAAAWGWACAAVLVALLLAGGGRRFRCGGRDSIVLPLRHDHPMLHDLRITESCPIYVHAAGWWPDVLPEPPVGGERPRVVGRRP